MLCYAHLQRSKLAVDLRPLDLAIAVVLLELIESFVDFRRVFGLKKASEEVHTPPVYAKMAGTRWACRDVPRALRHVSLLELRSGCAPTPRASPPASPTLHFDTIRVNPESKAKLVNRVQIVHPAEETTGGWGLEVLQPLNYLAKFAFLGGCDGLAGCGGDTEDLEEHGRPEGDW